MQPERAEARAAPALDETSAPPLKMGSGSQSFSSTNTRPRKAAMRPPHRRRPVRVLLVSDVRMFRDAVARWCSRHSLVRIVATAGHHDEATLHARRHAADVALLDMRMPDSLATAHAVAEAAPGVKLVGLGLSETEENVLVYAEAGFAGYVPREAPLEDLVPVLRSIGRGEPR